MKVTYYLEVVSSWCWWAEPAWEEIKRRYAGRAEFEWKLALMDATGFPISKNQLEWFYRRSGSLVRSPYMLNSGWFEPELKEYLAPNLVAEAAKSMGVQDDRVRLAIAEAALRRGMKVGQWDVSAEIAAKAANLEASQLLARAKSPEIEALARKSTAEFHALQVNQRPTFVIESSIGDRAVFSGLSSAAPLMSAMEAMFSDVSGYASHKAHFGDPPSV